MIYLSPTTQDTLQTAHTAVLCIASVLNVISLFFLIYETPPHQAAIRRYLLLTQVMVIVSMVYVDVLFKPIPLFPALAGMCFGVLCAAGAPVHTALGIDFIVYTGLNLSIFLCVLFRHHSLLPEAAKYAKSPYNLSWALERGACFMHERSPVVVVFMSSVVVLLMSTLLLLVGVFLHMLIVLDRDNKRSKMTIVKIRRSLLVLFIQLVVPISMLLVPGSVMFIGVLCDCIPFEANLFLFALLVLHPTAHNLILLGITPTYRRLMVSVPGRVRKAAALAMVTSSNVGSEAVATLQVSTSNASIVEVQRVQ